MPGDRRPAPRRAQPRGRVQASPMHWITGPKRTRELPRILSEPEGDDLEARLEAASDFCKDNDGAIDLAGLEAQAGANLARRAASGLPDRDGPRPARGLGRAGTGLRLADIATDAAMLLRAPDSRPGAAQRRRGAPDPRARPRGRAARMRACSTDLGTHRREIPGAGPHDAAADPGGRRGDREGGLSREVRSEIPPGLDLLAGRAGRPGGAGPHARRGTPQGLRGMGRQARRIRRGAALCDGTLGDAFAGMETDLGHLRALRRLPRDGRPHRRRRRAAALRARDRAARVPAARGRGRRHAARHAGGMRGAASRLCGKAEDARELLSAGRRHAALFLEEAAGSTATSSRRHVGSHAKGGDAERAVSDLDMELARGPGSENGSAEPSRSPRRRMRSPSRGPGSISSPPARPGPPSTGRRDLFARRDDLADRAEDSRGPARAGCRRRAAGGARGPARPASRPRRRHPQGLIDQGRILRVTRRIRERGPRPARRGGPEQGRARAPERAAGHRPRHPGAQPHATMSRRFTGACSTPVTATTSTRLRPEIAAIDAELTELSRHAIRDGLLTTCAPPAGQRQGQGRDLHRDEPHPARDGQDAATGSPRGSSPPAPGRRFSSSSPAG